MSQAEQAFYGWITEQGWEVTKRGWPDFLCRRDGALMAVEVKTGADVLRAEQVQALRDLHAAGIATFIWSPESGLRPYPAETTSSDGALALRVLELEQLLRRVLQERDALAEQLAGRSPKFFQTPIPPPPTTEPTIITTRAGVAITDGAVASLRHSKRRPGMLRDRNRQAQT